MFQAREFTFAGLPSSYFGLYCCDFGDNKHSDVSFGNKANIIEERIPGRVQPLHFGVNYHDEPLQFTLIFGGDEPIDRYDMQAIAMWLTGYQQYQWLTIDESDMESLFFRCLIRELTPISVGWFQFAFSAEVICDCPYAYSNPFEQSFSISGATDSTILLRNFSTARESLRPVTTIQCDGSKISNLTVANKTTGSGFVFEGIPRGSFTIVINNDTGIIKATNSKTEAEIDLYPYFNFEYFDMAPGDNYVDITCDGDITVTFSGRYLHNVGA